MRREAIVLLSGGLDSTTTLAIAQEEFEILALSFDYGQKNHFELKVAAKIASHFEVKEHKTIEIDLSVFAASSLTSDLAVEKGRTWDDIANGVPMTYVPARNTIFLSYALAWADSRQVRDIFIGVNQVDASGYPDCRSEFVDAFNVLANKATRMSEESEEKISIHAPLIDLDKSAIITKGTALGVDYSMTNSCYDPLPNRLACGQCDACLLRQKGFFDAGLEDPLPYHTPLLRQLAVK